MEKLARVFNPTQNVMSGLYAVLMERGEEQIALVLERVNHGVWDWTLETNEINFSPRWIAMLGYEIISSQGDGNNYFTWMTSSECGQGFPLPCLSYPTGVLAQPEDQKHEEYKTWWSR